MASLSNLKEIKKGGVILFNQDPCLVLEANFLRMQQRKPVMQTKLKNLQTGKTYDYNFKQGETVESVDLERTNANFLYRQGTSYMFMDNVTFDQVALEADRLAEKASFLSENLTVNLLYWGDKLINVEIPGKIDLRVTETEPGARGDTAQGSVMKQATLETGLSLKVPLFVKEGDVIRVNSSTGEYVERVT